MHYIHYIHYPGGRGGQRGPRESTEQNIGIGIGDQNTNILLPDSVDNDRVHAYYINVLPLTF